MTSHRDRGEPRDRADDRAEAGRIVDVHSHLFRQCCDFDDVFKAESARAHDGEVDLTVRWDDYAATSPAGTRTIVVGGKARRSGLWVEDRAVADYVGVHPDRLIGYLSVDPTQAAMVGVLAGNGHLVVVEGGDNLFGDRIGKGACVGVAAQHLEGQDRDPRCRGLGLGRSYRPGMLPEQEARACGHDKSGAGEEGGNGF